MRRKDREVTDVQQIYEIMDACTVCRLGFYDNGEVYILPLNFGCTREQDKTTLYFHGAKEGRKINLIENSPAVGFEMEANYLFKEGKLGCDATARFDSIIGNGIVSFVTDPTEKENALQTIMYQSTKRRDWTFEQKMLDVTCVFKLEITKLSCKSHE